MTDLEALHDKNYIILTKTKTQLDMNGSRIKNITRKSKQTFKQTFFRRGIQLFVFKIVYFGAAGEKSKFFRRVLAKMDQFVGMNEEKISKLTVQNGPLALLHDTLHDIHDLHDRQFWSMTLHDTVVTLPRPPGVPGSRFSNTLTSYRLPQCVRTIFV